MNDSNTPQKPPLPISLGAGLPRLRETFLLYFAEPPVAAAFHLLARRFYELVLECHHLWPAEDEVFTVAEMKAALADLRYLQGYFGAIGREREEHSLTPRAAELSQLAQQQTAELARIAEEVEQALQRTAG